MDNPVLSTAFPESTIGQLANILVPKKSTARQAENAFGVFLGYSVTLPVVSNNIFATALTAKMQTDIAAHAKYISDKILAEGLGGYSFYFYFLPFNNADVEKKAVMENILRGGS